MNEYSLFLVFAAIIAVIVCLHLVSSVIHDIRNE